MAIKYSSTIILIFLCLLQPYIKGFSVFYLIVLLPFFFFKNVLRLKREEFFLVVSMFVLCAFHIIIGFSNYGVFSSRLLFVFSLNVLIFFTAKVIVENVFKNRTEEYFGRVVFYAIFINSIFICLLNTSIVSHDVFYSIVTTNPLVFQYPIPRYPGFTYDAFSYISTLTAFSFIFLLRNYLHFRTITFKKFFVLSVITFMAIVFSGRAGILLSIMIVFLIFLCTKNKVIFFKLAVSFFLLFLISFSLNWQEYEWVKDWAFGFIFKLFSGSDIHELDSSVSGVVQSVFYPKNILLGDGTDFSNIRSDLGFTRLFVSTGIIGLIFTVTLLFSPYIYVSLKYKSIPLFIVSCSLLLLNFKDVYLVSPYGHFMLLNMLFVFVLVSKKVM
ncbi:hypothetical protein HLBENOHH_03132 [Aeromonas dhakensis]|uniref:hypothetical protein n=1 Tax=Aeromonas dhakensis TaxID=196024 RepID=UPI00366C3D67